MIYYPFFVLFILILCRLKLFANWQWPPSLLIVFATTLMLPLYCNWRLRGAAEAARRFALDQLREDLRHNPWHLAAQRRGREEFYSWYDISVSQEIYRHDFDDLES